ncbi:MAG: hypothetical protein GX901_07870 [Lentisphaerae bacterium]|nr:hypothetical protein [Lentisphaerota bacterium]
MLKNTRICFVFCFSLLPLLLTAQSAQISSMQQKAGLWLLSRQNQDGSWLGETAQPAFTALACMGLYDSPLYQSEEGKANINLALDYIVAAAKPDGGIYGASSQAAADTDKGKALSKRGGRGGRGGGPGGGGAMYAVYNSSICLAALAKFNRPQDLELCKKTRAYLLATQTGDNDAASAGGMSYGGSKKMRADLSNTAWTLEALYVTEHLDKEPHNSDPAQAAKAGLAWKKALEFITICQNLADTNSSAWVRSAPEQDRGGFIYCPEDALKEGASEALRSYGSMTYAGLKSLIYAKVDKDDIRIQSAFDWLKKYYSIEENPGAGAAGYYYYLHLLAKTLTLMGEETLLDDKGGSRAWKSELLAKLAETQNEDGSWMNEKSGRWMESIPELSSAYVLMTLGMLK